MSTQLITFENNKLVLSSLISCDAKVITVTGSARKGKSSLLNTICSYLTKENAAIFYKTYASQRFIKIVS